MYINRPNRYTNRPFLEKNFQQKNSRMNVCHPDLSKKSY
jgi:hypothetical protein